MSDLKPCPFCGGKARKQRLSRQWSIFCTNAECTCEVVENTFGCVTSLQIDEKESAIVDRWNARAQPAYATLSIEDVSKLEREKLALIEENEALRKQIAEKEIHRAKELEGLQSKTPQWISVGDGLPECGENVLVWDGNDIEIDFTDIEVEFGTTYFSNTQGYTTHWMPLPPQPEGN